MKPTCRKSRKVLAFESLEGRALMSGCRSYHRTDWLPLSCRGCICPNSPVARRGKVPS